MGLLNKIFGIKSSEPQSVPIANESAQSTELQEQEPVQPSMQMPVQETTTIEEPPKRRYPKHPFSSGSRRPGAVDFKRLDPMFADVARYVVSKQEGSTSRMMRVFELGYNRAGKLSDQLEAAGIVGPNKGPKGRDVLIQDMDNLEELLSAIGAGTYRQERPVVSNSEGEKAELFLLLRKNVTSKIYDTKILEVIPWIIDEEEVYPEDIEEEFGVDFDRAQDILTQMQQLGILEVDECGNCLTVRVDDPHVVQMLCEYLKAHCEMIEPEFDITTEFEHIKSSINYKGIKDLDPKFEDVADWIVRKSDFTISDLVTQFQLPMMRAIDIADQLTDVNLIHSTDSDGQCLYQVLVHKQVLVSKICQYVRDYVCGYVEEPNIEKETEKAVPNTEVCYVYLMHDNSNGFYKIGISKDPQYRERTLQSEKPTIDKICAKEFPSRQIAEAIESALHKSYSDKRLRGEWFNLEENDVINIIKTLS